MSVQGRAIKLLQGGAAASISAAEQASHREVQGLEQRLEQKAGAVAKQVEALDQNMRSLQRDSTAQKAQLQAVLTHTADTD